MTTTEPVVLFEKRDSVLRVSLNRTDVLNAVNRRVLEELEAGLRANAGSSDTRVLMLYGRGRCFASGADISELADLDEAGLRDFHQLREGTFALLEDFPCPTIAVIHGYALGTGLELALSCDFRIAAADARLGVPSAKLGIAESYEYISRLVRAVGPFRAKKLLLTAEKIDAAAAFHIGLVEEVVPADDLFNRAEALAVDIAGNSTHSMVESKKAVAVCVENPTLFSIPDTAATMIRSMQSGDFREGVAAFLDKRQAKFK